MFFEIVLIQRLTLYFGNPIYSAAAVISGLLIFSGIGSFFSQKLKVTKQTLLLIPLIVSILIFILILVLSPVIEISIGLSFIVKFLIVLLLLAPPSFLMGIPFPIGIRYLNINKVQMIPWAWGVNGFLSVIATSISTIIAIQSGFNLVIFFAAIFYLLTVLATIIFKKK
jgi:hypothetical protein